MKYEVFFGQDLQQLEDMVNESIQEGWSPLGGIAVTQSDKSTQDHDGLENNNFQRVWAQAMTHP